jgi:hypothetical protein
MKKAEDFIEEIGHGLYTSYCVKNKNNEFTVVMSIENAKKAIKLAQKDAIRETVIICARNARTCDDLNSYCGNTDSEYPPDIVVDKQSILKVAEKLIKEL